MRVYEIIGDRSQWLTHPEYDNVTPLVSVILPTFSRGKSGLLKKCLDSVLNQSFRRLELIIVDDASVDGTFDICKKYMGKDPRVCIIRHIANIGLPAVSTYEAYLKARSRYIAYAFDDNQWELDALARTYDFMEENNVKASYGVTKAMEADGQHFVEFGKEKQNIADTIWMGNRIGAGSVVLRREVLETVGLHDPHLALTRICDWDLWQRIVERFEFVATGIFFTTELGVTQLDSLGNSFKLDQWFVRERQQRRNLKMLLAENYGENDVLDYSASSSPYYLQCLLEHYQQYRSRTWFSQNEYDRIATEKGNEHVKRVLVLCADLTNSFMSMTVDNYEYVFCFSLPGVVHPSFFALADIAVFARAFYEQTNLLSLLRQLKIPCYYFTDDNFRELAVDASDSGIQHLAKMTNAQKLKDFAGVIVTSELLRKYFVAHHLHHNVILLGALYHPSSAPRPESDGTVTVGFMGGMFREATLKACVLPALKKIAKERPIRLVLPCTKETEERIKKLGEGFMEIVLFHRTVNYEYLLNFYREQGVDVLVHCGGNLRNNVYKTKNALLNATSLGAALIASDIEPYCYRDPDEPDGDYLVTRNTPEEWEKNLRILIEDPKKRLDVVHIAKQYCETQYGLSIVWSEADAKFSKVPVSSMFVSLKRYEELAGWLLRSGNHIGVRSESVPFGYRPYNPELLRFSGELKNHCKFGFTPGVDCIREIGLLFAVIGECLGTVTLKITNHRSELLTEMQLRMENLMRDAYTNLFLPHAISVRPKELLYMEFFMEYEIKDGFLGVFWDNTRCTFFYKLFNHFGHPIPGKNVLFIDCRS